MSLPVDLGLVSIQFATSRFTTARSEFLPTPIPHPVCTQAFGLTWIPGSVPKEAWFLERALTTTQTFPLVTLQYPVFFLFFEAWNNLGSVKTVMTVETLGWPLRSPLPLNKPESGSTGGDLGTLHLYATTLQNSLYQLHCHVGWLPILSSNQTAELCHLCFKVWSLRNHLGLGYSVFSLTPADLLPQSLTLVITYLVYFQGPCPKMMVTNHLVPEHLTMPSFPWLGPPWTVLKIIMWL